MPITPTARVENGKDLVKFFEVLGDEMSDRNFLGSVTQAGASPFFDKVYRNTPVDTGRLRSTLRQHTYEENGQIISEVGYDPNVNPEIRKYAHVVEARQKPLQRAFDSTVDEAGDAAAAEFHGRFFSLVKKAAGKTRTIKVT